jgi:hypothetical protein
MTVGALLYWRRDVLRWKYGNLFVEKPKGGAKAGLHSRNPCWAAVMTRSGRFRFGAGEAPARTITAAREFKPVHVKAGG